LCFPALTNPTFAAPQQRRLTDLRNQLCSGDPDIETLVEILIDKLDLLPQNLTTKQIAMTMLGWTQCKSDTRYFMTLEKDLDDHSSGQDSGARLSFIRKDVPVE
jgi:hypothetical protein